MRGTSRRRAPALICALWLAACSPPKAPSTIRVAHEIDAFTLDPAEVAESATHSILSNIYESLVAFDKEMRLIPALAVHWSTPDDRTWMIELRPNVRFHDGRLLTAEDVKAALERAQSSPASGIKGHLATVAGVDIVGPGTLKIRTLRPDPLLLNRLTYMLVGRFSEKLGRLVGTGPYRLVRWEKGKELEVEAFSDYWHGRPAIDRAFFVPVEEGEASLVALQRQGVDVLRPFPETLWERGREQRGFRIEARAGLSTYYFWYNSEAGRGDRNPFADRRVRQALSLAIDREALMPSIHGNGAPASQLVQQGVFGYVASLPELRSDPEAARRLLADAGYPRGFDVTLAHRPSASLEVVVRALQEQLAKVGIRARLETQPWPALVQKLKTGTIGFMLAGWRFEDGDAMSFLKDCVYTRDAARNTGDYNPGFSNRELDRLIDENDQLIGESARLKHYDALMRLAMQEMPLVPLYHRYSLYGVSDRVKWEPRLDEKLLVAEMSLKPR